jgi:catechol 2,3-dioxygenase-like lactoylglutathione lyase family enzyme
MPEVTGILEAALYVADLERAARFYAELLGFERIAEDARFCAFGVAGRQVLLLFLKGGSVAGKQIPGGKIPAHDADGQMHVAFSIDEDQWTPWLERLAALGIPVESEVQWPRGGRSIYFRDPDGHSIEFVTPGCWSVY